MLEDEFRQVGREDAVKALSPLQFPLRLSHTLLEKRQQRGAPRHSLDSGNAAVGIDGSPGAPEQAAHWPKSQHGVVEQSAADELWIQQDLMHMLFSLHFESLYPAGTGSGGHAMTPSDSFRDMERTVVRPPAGPTRKTKLTCH